MHETSPTRQTAADAPTVHAPDLRSLPPVKPSIATQSSDSPDVSVIAVNWNCASLLTHCLRSVDRELASLNGECIVVDNASSPDDLALLRARCKRYALIANAENRGFASAVNQGLERSRGRYVMLLNPDAFLGRGSLRHLVEYLDGHPKVAVVGPRILDPDGAVQGSARSFPGALTALAGRTAFLTRRFPRNALSVRQIPALACDRDGPISVDWVSGACLLARRRALEQIGHLDDRFFMFWEDADVCWRLRKRGWQVMYDPRARVVHLVGASTRFAPVRAAVEFHRSAFRLYRKHVTGSAWHPFTTVAAAGLLTRGSLVAIARLWSSWRPAGDLGLTAPSQRDPGSPARGARRPTSSPP